MPRPVKLDGTDEDTKLLGTLVHWVMCNNLLTILNKYPAIQAVSYSLMTPQSTPPIMTSDI